MCALLVHKNCVVLRHTLNLTWSVAWINQLKVRLKNPGIKDFTASTFKSSYPLERSWKGQMKKESFWVCTNGKEAWPSQYYIRGPSKHLSGTTHKELSEKTRTPWSKPSQSTDPWDTLNDCYFKPSNQLKKGKKINQNKNLNMKILCQNIL